MSKRDPAPHDGAHRTSQFTVIALLAVTAIVGFGTGKSTADDKGGSTALAVLALAAIPAIFAVPAVLRRVLGGLLAAVAAGVALLSVTSSSPTAVEWIQVAALAVAGLITVWRGGTWRGMGSRFSERSEPSTTHPTDLWRALDRGEDPTAGPAAGPTAGPTDSPEANGPEVQ